MHTQNTSSNSDLVTIHQIVRNVNADNLNEDIIVFDHGVSFHMSDIYPSVLMLSS